MIFIALLISLIQTDDIKVNCEHAVIYDIAITDDKIWAIDVVTSQLFQIEKNGDCKTFAEYGKGPGDLENPEVIMINNDHLVVVNLNGKISYFDMTGEYIGGVIPSQNIFPVNQFVIKNDLLISAGLAFPQDRNALNAFNSDGKYLGGLFEADFGIIQRNVLRFSKLAATEFGGSIYGMWSLDYKLLRFPDEFDEIHTEDLEIPEYFRSPTSYRSREEVISESSNFWTIDRLLSSSTHLGVVTSRVIDYDQRHYQWLINLYNEELQFETTIAIPNGRPIHLDDDFLFFYVDDIEASYIYKYEL